MKIKQLFERLRNEEGTEIGQEDFTPVTTLQSIYDDTTKVPLDQILALVNHWYLPYNGNAIEVYNKIPSIMRHAGLIITYRDEKDSPVTRQYIGASYKDSEWSKISNWVTYPQCPCGGGNTGDDGNGGGNEGGGNTPDPENPSPPLPLQVSFDAHGNMSFLDKLREENPDKKFKIDVTSFSSSVNAYVDVYTTLPENGGEFMGSETVTHTFEHVENPSANISWSLPVSEVDSKYTTHNVAIITGIGGTVNFTGTVYIADSTGPQAEAWEVYGTASGSSNEWTLYENKGGASIDVYLNMD